MLALYVGGACHTRETRLSSTRFQRPSTCAFIGILKSAVQYNGWRRSVGAAAGDGVSRRRDRALSSSHGYLFSPFQSAGSNRMVGPSVAEERVGTR